MDTDKWEYVAVFSVGHTKQNMIVALYILKQDFITVSNMAALWADLYRLRRKLLEGM
jgi:hypothetical protein